MNGIPKFDFEHKLTKTTENKIIIPQIPKVPPDIIKSNLKSATGSYKFGITKVEIEVKATTIIVGAPMSPEFTAASPTTNPPTILTACPKF